MRDAAVAIIKAIRLLQLKMSTFLSTKDPIKGLNQVVHPFIDYFVVDIFSATSRFD